MEELLQRLQNEHKLTEQEAKDILKTISGYIKEKVTIQLKKVIHKIRLFAN